MRIGITGITGYIGGALAKECVEAGHDVVGFSRDPDKEPTGATEMRRFEKGEAGDFSGLDAVCHFAAEPIFGIGTDDKERRVRESRVGLTSFLVEQLSKLDEPDRPTVLISASGSGYYGDRGDDWLTESEPAGEGFFPELAKDWEAAALKAEQLGMRAVCPRIGVVIGPGSPACETFKKIFGAGLGGKLGSGKQWFPWVSKADLVRMCLESLDDDAISGPVNAVSPNPVRNSEMTRLIADILHRPAIVPVPKFGLKMALGDLAAPLLDSTRMKADVWEERGFEYRFPKLESALRNALE